MSKVYHQVTPENHGATNSFTEFQTADFILAADGRKLVKGSITLEGQINVQDDGGNFLHTSNFGIEQKIGFHAICESIDTEVQSMGQIERLNDYPRMVNVVNSASMNENDVFTVKAAAEGIGLNQENGRYVLQQINPKFATAAGASYGDDVDFAIKPMIALNNSLGDDYAFSKNGYIKITVNFARVSDAFFGRSNAATTTYTLNNLKVRFETRPDDGQYSDILMNSYVSVKSAINTSRANIQARVPSKNVNGVVVSFLKQSDQSSFKENSYKLADYPGFESVKYLFNSSQNKYITYNITSKSEALRRGLDALTDAGYNRCNGHTIVRNNGFIMGLPFDGSIDLSQEKFNIELNSASNDFNTNQYNVYMYFLTTIKM